MKFTLVMGLPTAGKHQFAENFAKENDAEYIKLDDAETLTSRLEHFVSLLTKEKSVVCDAIGFDLEDREAFIDALITATDDYIIDLNCIFVPYFITTAIPDYDKMLGLLGSFQSPYLQEGWDSLECLSLYSEQEIEAYEDFLLDAASNHSLPNGKTLKSHLEGAAQYVLGHSCYVADLRAAKWHDIGKIFSYENHANISAYLWLHTSKGMMGWLKGNLDKKESLFVGTVITFHTVVYEAENEEAWKEYFKERGFDENTFAAALALYNANKTLNK